MSKIDFCAVNTRIKFIIAIAILLMLFVAIAPAVPSSQMLQLLLSLGSFGYRSCWWECRCLWYFLFYVVVAHMHLVVQPTKNTPRQKDAHKKATNKGKTTYENTRKTRQIAQRWTKGSFFGLFFILIFLFFLVCSLLLIWDFLTVA